MKHGDPQQPDLPIEVWLGPDPELALVEADMDAWMDAHPCDCAEESGLCQCHEEERA